MSKVGDRHRRYPEGLLFNSSYPEVQEKEHLLPWIAPLCP